MTPAATSPDPTSPGTEPGTPGPDELAELDELSYEAAREQLAEVVHQLESGGTGLAESLALWQRGERLARVCQTRLDGARETVRAARESADPADPADGGEGQQSR